MTDGAVNDRDRTAGIRIVMLGAPGSGKGTQAKRLESDEGLVQVSTGDLLRSAVAQGTALGRQAKAIMDAGDLVPDDVVLGLIKERITRPDAQAGFVLDGYPRNGSQAEDLERVLAELALTIDRAVLMDVDFDVLLKRLTGRRTCTATGEVLNVHFSPKEKLDACIAAGGELVRRADDTEETIRNRLDVYRQQTAPLIEHYETRGLLTTVDATGDVDEVYARLRAALGL